MEDFISVIVPVYNVENYVSRCIDSILDQTYKNFELIIIDDGSSDRSPMICDDYANRATNIRVIHQENKGLSMARNAGIEVAKGTYITFIDSDDYVCSVYLEVLLTAIKKHNSDISICNYVMVYDDGQSISRTSTSGSFTPEQAIKIVCYRTEFDSNATARLYKKSLFDLLRFKEGVLYEDTEIFYKLYHKCKRIEYTNKPCYFYYQNEKSIMHERFNEKKMDLVMFMDELMLFVKTNYPSLENAVVSRSIYSYCFLLNMLLGQSEWKQYETYLVKRIKDFRWRCLFNREEHMKNKIAVVTLMFGVKFYHKVFQIYKCFKD